MHKTAYELRISDWSSEVCSSDLGPKITFQSNPSMAGSPLRLLGPDFDLIRLRIDFSPPLGEDLCVRAVLDHIHQHAVDLVAKIGVALADTHGIGNGIEPVLTDRKRVVSGKSVSVRVDLGGRRIIKKKIK